MSIKMVLYDSPRADREVIDAEHVDVPGPGDWLGADEPDQHVAAARHRQLPGQA